MGGQTESASVVGAGVFALDSLRLSPAYQAAERKRRKLGTDGAVQMAQSNPGSEDYADIRLLIGTWDSIGLAVGAGMFNREAVYMTQPICHMWEKLGGAVEFLRGQEDPGPAYARHFEKLNDDLSTWGRQGEQNTVYVTQSCGGMHAKFG